MPVSADEWARLCAERRATVDTEAANRDLSARIRGAMIGMHIGDSLAFPFHWYYSFDILKQHIEQYYPSDGPGIPYTAVHPDLRHGHPDASKYFANYKFADGQMPIDIVHEQKEAWQTPGTHYHHRLEKGDVTMTVQLARLLMASLNDCGGYDFAEYLQRYERFFREQGQHMDT